MYKMTQLIQSRQSVRYPGLHVKKYTKRVFYDNRWHEDPMLLESRGHVYNDRGSLVINPMTKIFNRFENNTDIDRDEECVVVTKVNGFMAAATYVPDVADVVVSTTGSLDSEYVDLAERELGFHVVSYIKSMSSFERRTYVFEIVHPSDPHIIQEESGAYLLGYRDIDDRAAYFTDEAKEAELDRIAMSMGVKRPLWSTARFGDVVEAAKSVQHEGFVVYGQRSRTALKIKSPMYLTLKAAARRKDIESLDLSRIDEEFYGLVASIKKHKDQFNAMDEQTRLNFMRNWIVNGDRHEQETAD
jgi:hypothetical protein